MQIFGGGVYINILLAVGIYLLIHTWIAFLALTKNVDLPLDFIQETLISFVFFVAAIKFRYILSCWSPPFFGIVMTGLLWMTFTTPGLAEQSTTGPIGIVAMGAKSTSLFDVVALIFAITLSLGLFNALPIPPLDGGHMAVALMKHLKVPLTITKIYEKIGLMLFIIFIVLVFGNDLRNLLIT